jgi:hypothetical protein
MVKKNIGGNKEDNSLFKVISIILLVFLAFFLTGYFLKDAGNTVVYNDITFQKSGDVWVGEFKYSGQYYKVPFYYNPTEVSDIIVNTDAIDPILQIDRSRGWFIVSVDPDIPAFMGVAGTQIARVTGTRYGLLNIPTKAVFYSTPDFETEEPIINCSQANHNLVVLHLQVGEENSIIRDGYCITLTAIDKDGAYMTADRFVFELLKIM